MTITNADLRFNENGTPYATQFEDLYFSDSKGFDESQHVFLANNLLPQRWKDFHPAQFVIAETGFGTGLNFLVTLANFVLFKEQHPSSRLQLHFISIEKYPIGAADLRRALTLYPQLQAYSQVLLNQYPPALAGCHRLFFLDNSVILDLWLGDVHQVLPKIENTNTGRVDCWFLDGFAPSKNPEMWTQTLFDKMAFLAKDQCTFATFTAAGHVKRGLRQAGFEVFKRPAHGRKRDMLAGSITKTQNNATRLPYFARQGAQCSLKKTHSPPTVAIIGGGLAGANCAYALSKRGMAATVYCKESSLAQGASGNAQGGFYPQLNAVAGVSSQIHATAFTYAKRLYEELLVNGQDFAHQWCGTLQIAFNDKVTARQQKMMNNNTWPPSFIHQLDAQQASAVAKVSLPYSGLFIPSAGWINLPQLVQALCQAAKSQIACDKRLTQLNPQGEGWQIDWHDGSHTQADIVILAMGSDSLACQQLADVPFRLVRGQVESIASQGELTQLDTVLCHKGYMTPAWQGQHALGSTYIKQDKSCEYRLSEQQLNLGMHQQALIHCDWAQQMQTQSTGRAAIRCSTPDHLPIVGAVADFAKQKSQYQDLYKALPAAHYPAPSDHPNLFVLSGLGSRGLSTAPLCAEILISQILGQPVPLANDLLDALSPNRFLIKGLIRRTL